MVSYSTDEWLGYDNDLESGHLSFPDTRIVSMKQSKIMSTSLVTMVTGNFAKVMTKALHISVESRYSCDSCIVLSLQALDELIGSLGANIKHLYKSIFETKQNVPG